MSLLLLAGAIFLVTLIGSYVLMTTFGRPKDRPKQEQPRQRYRGEEVVAEYQPRTDTAPLLTHLLQITRGNDFLQWQLLQAGLLFKPSEMLFISVAAGLALYVTAVLFGLSTGAQGFLTLIGLSIPWIYVVVRKQTRYKLLVTQLPEALQLVASSLRSGFSILRAIEVVADEMPTPISQEFRWVLDEVNVGLSMEKAFGNMTRRTQSPDVKLMVTAIQIQSGVGGDLAEVLETTSGMIRQRFQLTAEIAALTAEGRLSALILGGLPIGLAGMIHILNPEYMHPLIAEPMGHMMLIGGGSLMLFGVLLIRNMLNVDV